LLTTTAYADSYQRLLEAYNDRQPAESLYAQIGKNLSKRIATEAERSNLAFIAIYGGVAHWDKSSLRNKIHVLTQHSIAYIGEPSLESHEKQYRTEHYVNLVVLCVASHLNDEKAASVPLNDIIKAIQDNARNEAMHSHVFSRLMSLKAGDIQKILNEYNFDDSYQLAKEYVRYDESIRGNTGKMPRDILFLSRDQAIKYQEALLKISELNKAYEARKTTVTPAAASPSLKAVFPTAETGDSKVSSEKDDGNRQKSMASASAAGGHSDEIIINGTEGVWINNRENGSIFNSAGNPTFTESDWEQAMDGTVIIRGNMYSRKGGMIRVTGKYIPAPPPPAPRAAPPFTENSSVTPKKPFLEEIVGATLRATPQKTEEQKRAEQEKKEKEEEIKKVAQKEIDAINVEIKKIENNIIQKIEKRKYEFLKINRK
jgi:hypothetical protein